MVVLFVKAVACFRTLSASLSVMLQLGNFSAWIVVDGKTLKEYGVEISDDGMEATCWIPSKVGQVRSRTSSSSISGI